MQTNDCFVQRDSHEEILVNCYWRRDFCKENDASCEESGNDISCEVPTENDTPCEESGYDASLWLDNSRASRGLDYCNCYLRRDSCEENDASCEESGNDISCEEPTENDTEAQICPNQ